MNFLYMWTKVFKWNFKGIFRRLNRSCPSKDASHWAENSKTFFLSVKPNSIQILKRQIKPSKAFDSIQCPKEIKSNKYHVNFLHSEAREVF